MSAPPEEGRRAEGAVDDERDAVPVRDLRDGVDVGDVGVGIAEDLGVQQLRVLLDGLLEV